MNAVATLLYDEKYLPGALVLGHVLRKIRQKDVEMVILIDLAAFKDWQLDLLRETWDKLIDTKVSESSLRHKLEHDLKRPELAKTYTKIELWNLPYEKVLYLDADVLPLEGENPVTNLLKLDFPKGKILAAPDAGFPDIFNSGVFALIPNSTDFLSLTELVVSNSNDASFDGADQGLLNQYFNADPDWVSKALASNEEQPQPSLVSGTNWIRIPFLYNTTPSAQYQYYPASSHFGYPETRSSAPGHRGSEENSDKSTSPNLIRNFESLSVSAYGEVALEHFSTGKSNARISVLHFIGPVKPWNNEDSPIFKRWWQQWYEYSHGKSVDSILRRQRFPAMINELSPPSSSKVLSAVQVKTPADLCDPSNYSHLKSPVDVNAHYWDATTESPPKTSPMKSGSVLQKTDNDWGSFIYQEQSHREHAMSTEEASRLFETPSHGHDSLRNTESSVREITSDFGLHTEQVAERVFDEHSDYIPHHPLMVAHKDTVADGKADFIEELNDALDNSFSKSKNNRSNGDYSREGIRGALEPILAETSGYEDELPKIFPWEFKENIPERVWD
ncbi:hypothetical protein OXX80_011886 [Metschnikowia pulcherrima]